MGEGADGRISAEKIAAASISKAERADEAVASRRPMPLNEGLNDDAIEMDRAIAHEVFGIPLEVLDVWPFALPSFSTDRLDANRAMAELSWDAECRPYLEAALQAEVSPCFPTDKPPGLVGALTVLSPDAVCRALLSVTRTYGAPGSTPGAGNRPRAFRAAVLGSALEPRPETQTGRPACAGLPAARSTAE